MSMSTTSGLGGGAKAKKFRHSSAYEYNFKGSTMSEAGGLFRGVHQEFLHFKNSLIESATGGKNGGPSSDYKNKRKR